MRRFLVLALMGLAACTSPFDPEVENSGLGDFSLQHLVVIVDEPIQGAVSRGVTDAQLKTAVTDAVDARFRRFAGDTPYSIGIKVQGYVLAPRAVPVLFAPRSQLYLSVNAYDGAQQRLNADTRNLIVNERAGGDTVIGSGYYQTAEEQLAELAENAAIEIERWLRENEDWFGGAAARPETRATSQPDAENPAGGA
ncbi:hypothetical protein ACVDG3_06475 [Meridianimarinicoccus sp. RP-17]|uniref:hypothetical protein n=1 Tax=Meridianimarinicoccus zhengii TaxID=2056810 RepID=UPI000DAE2B7D|nr:hypothetical protein [Phycocomes zhengii]